jgi:hypothetical protein
MTTGTRKEITELANIERELLEAENRVLEARRAVERAEAELRRTRTLANRPVSRKLAP